MKRKDISIVIVTYNVRKLLIDCLESIKNSNDTLSKEIFVVDNGDDDTYTYFENKKEYIYIKNKENLGFSKANNIALKKATGRYLLILNPDTKLKKNTLSIMYNFMQENKDIGLSTCPLYLPDKSLDKACRRNFPTIKSALGKIFFLSRISTKFEGYNIDIDNRTQTDIDACSGAFMFARSEIFKGDKHHKKVSFFDEDFWAMGEDLDLCYRIKKSGWRITFYPKTSILHYKGASGGLKKSSRKLSSADMKTKRKWLKAYSDAMYIFYKKHYLKKHSKFTNFTVVIGIQIYYILKISKLVITKK
jgi:GT2 family glycosyltransferase